MHDVEFILPLSLLMVDLPLIKIYHGPHLHPNFFSFSVFSFSIRIIIFLIKKITLNNVNLTKCDIYKNPLNGVDVSTCNISKIKISTDDVRGIIIDQFQSIDLVTMLDVKIK